MILDLNTNTLFIFAKFPSTTCKVVSIDKKIFDLVERNLSSREIRIKLQNNLKLVNNQYNVYVNGMADQIVEAISVLNPSLNIEDIRNCFDAHIANLNKEHQEILRYKNQTPLYLDEGLSK
jgi:hypothetical protein